MRLYHITCVLVSLAPAAFAGVLPDGGVTAEEVADVLRGKGFQAQIATDKEGDPLVRSSAGGVRFGVYFYGCNHQPRCKSIQFSAGIKTKGVAQAKMTEWNRTKRFGRAYIDDESDPWLNMDMDVEHGATTEALANDLERWSSVLGIFTKFIEP